MLWDRGRSGIYGFYQSQSVSQKRILITKSNKDRGRLELVGKINNVVL